MIAMSGFMIIVLRPFNWNISQRSDFGNILITSNKVTSLIKNEKGTSASAIWRQHHKFIVQI